MGSNADEASVLTRTLLATVSFSSQLADERMDVDHQAPPAPPLNGQSPAPSGQAGPEAASRTAQPQKGQASASAPAAAHAARGRMQQPGEAAQSNLKICRV